VSGIDSCSYVDQEHKLRGNCQQIRVKGAEAEFAQDI